uniref:Uncharacterized protein n=1 Tax=Nelumbo nucifera TaxID=4432 RepID=A0A822Z1X8_NELNU|nr:TPA_asm: hypothetical protein HUJ06_008332 [Nelumbo nucifera]
MTVIKTLFTTKIYRISQGEIILGAKIDREIGVHSIGHRNQYNLN